MHTSGTRLYHLVTSRFNVALAVAGWFLWMSADHEERLYEVFADSCTSPTMTDLEKVQSLMRCVHRVIRDRQPFFSNDPRHKLRSSYDTIFRSGDLELTQTDQGCGTHAAIFVEASRVMGLPARLVQLRKDGRTVHIFSEVLLDGKWVVADATFQQMFRNPQGKFVGARDIVGNWSAYKDQAAPGYPTDEFDYEEVRYTNWDKVPVVLPAVKGILNLILGTEQADQISVRTYVLNRYQFYLWTLLSLGAIVNGFRFWRFCRKRPAPSNAASAAPESKPSNLASRERSQTASKLL